MGESTGLLSAELRQTLERLSWRVRCREAAWVTRVGDGVATVRGAPSVRYGELMERSDGLTALAFDLRAAETGLLFLDSAEHVAAGDEFRATGRVASAPVGETLLGRVVDALGRPLDGGPRLRPEAIWPVEREAPGVVERQPVREPLHTGVKILDALLPIGRGQRELILGDRGTGKSALALDAILAQRDSGVACIYVAIGQRKASVAEVIRVLTEHEALRYTAVIAAVADSPPGQQYLAPYTGCTLGEFLMQRGRSVLIVFDDLTKHADAYRRISLLLGRPPGREAYPADIFYLHARLLERATRLHDRLGGGSLTALPIAATQAGNIASYVPTNLISITDGQIYLNARLFNAGVRPAVDVGLSVSRVGGKAQPDALRRQTGDLRLLYARLPELETFTRFGAELEGETRRLLERGRRLREVLKQPRLLPWRLGHEVAVLLALRQGFLDPIPVEEVGKAIDSLCRHLDVFEPAVLGALENGASFAPEHQERIRAILETARVGHRSENHEQLPDPPAA